MKTTLSITILTICILVMYYFVRPLFYSSENRFRIAMCGRSTMGLWFKHWNWPYPLRIKFTYRSWPIAYHKYARDNLYLEYLPIDSPNIRDTRVEFGENMLRSFTSYLDKGPYDAAFLKFCFVDFPIEDTQWQARYDNLKKTVIAAHDSAAKKQLKLIVGNALPLLTPSDTTIHLQKAFNTWLNEFAASHKDVMVFDFFNLLTDEEGRMRKELARGNDDPHPNDRAFTLLDKAFFIKVSDWLGKQSF